MPEKTKYDILGVDPGASDREIKEAYNKASRESHPDTAARLNPNATPEDLEAIQKVGQERFREVTDAYQTLKNPSERASYDESLMKGAIAKPNASNPSMGPFDKGTVDEENTVAADANANADGDADADADAGAGAGADAGAGAASGARQQKIFESKPQQPTQNPLMDMWNRMVAEIEALYGKVLKMLFSNEGDAGSAYSEGKKNETKDGPLSDTSNKNESDKDTQSTDPTSALEHSPSTNQQASSQVAPLSDTPGIRPSPSSSSLSIEGQGYDAATATTSPAPDATSDLDVAPQKPLNPS